MKYLCLIVFILPGVFALAQNRYSVEESTIVFFSDGVVEDIKATNKSVTSIYDLVKKEIAFLVKIKDFEFEKKLMQVHFNEKFLESDKYPKSTFVGVVSGFDREKQGVQQVTATGKLFIHGVTRDVKIPGTLERVGSKLFLKSRFMVRLADYNISIPQVIWQNIAEEVEVNLNFVYVPF